MEEQRKERGWVAGVGWGKARPQGSDVQQAVADGAVHKVVEGTAEQEWLEAADEQVVQQKEHEEKAAEFGRQLEGNYTRGNSRTERQQRKQKSEEEHLS